MVTHLVIITFVKSSLSPVTRSELFRGSKLQLQHDCRGIVHHEGELFIYSGSVLFNYLLSGKIISELYEDRSMERCAVSPTWDRLFRTTPSQHKLLALARDGTLLATLTHPELEPPHGVHVIPACQVLVCGWRSHTMLQIDSEGRRKLATLVEKMEGWRDPLSVCYSRTTSSIIVGQWRDNILVFRVE
ncbi:uncharacterized protein LOC127832094 [Dreissena polymorpha]|uniref:Uncharacterized protein n=1 Tax=Dreissena polymorpha TaxID=45954 RepID=A0A9D4JNK1_DREPO|nr:uncharacterized protein LOC127832094 [Dreissena polymorpha]KAH3818735.1 hypothetical protein DPMN_120460 [Dreissena polymorpha]